MIFLAIVLFLAVDLLVALSIGVRMFAVIAFLFTASEVLWDWYKRGWDYVSASRFNYGLKALTSITPIILLTWFFTLPHHRILWLAGVHSSAPHLPNGAMAKTEKLT